eukprot:TRINITY_DN2635_c0_g1_i2.p1 TRINITY_DN2635_c0_g1~~TRINITY_DN2635_c0_g1_i2.p1  ORF type:complete len:238 (-),score=83.39 TRINITY_DN2635_c0_g1_i2:64-777(-)
MPFLSKKTTSTTSSSTDRSTSRVKNQFHPHTNSPSFATRLFEIINILLLLVAGVYWLGGAMAIIISVYLFALAILGLFAWPRRHLIIWILFAITLIIAVIVNIILVSSNNARKVPYTYEYPNADQSGTGIGSFTGIDSLGASSAGTFTFSADGDDDRNNNEWVNSAYLSIFAGHRTLHYITAGISLLLLLLGIPLAAKIATERRHKKITTVQRNVVEERYVDPNRPAVVAPPVATVV